MIIHLDIPNLPRFIAGMEARSAGVETAVDRLLSATGARLEADAKILAPVDTGNLRNSISSDRTSEGNTRGVEVGPTANYGKFVEDGTSRMRPQPYMGPAFDRAARQFTAGMAAIAAGGTLR